MNWHGYFCQILSNNWLHKTGGNQKNNQSVNNTVIILQIYPSLKAEVLKVNNATLLTFLMRSTYRWTSSLRLIKTICTFKSAAIFEKFPGFFCHKCTIWQVLMPLTQEILFWPLYVDIYRRKYQGTYEKQYGPGRTCEISFKFVFVLD